MSRIYPLLLIWLLSAALSCEQTKVMNHVFYLHGMIIETQGIHAVSDVFGPYKYEDIIDTLKAAGYKVHAEVRTTQTDFNAFCQKTSRQIDRLIREGVSPKNITVIGASKGAMMAMQISNLNQHPVKYVLLGANNDRTEKNFDWKLHGFILGIYERSDKVAGKDYTYWINRSTEAQEFKQLEINTGLGHGFLYTPITAWMEPTKKWIEHE